ncbi:25S rRNA (cytosine(2870)-C(5))-methyltransferase [Malassezia caprae]|uniref:Nucleolar protein 2 n=1 Tax=Malassezia caprae TaxID=1381934 RepID=A0AAF0IVK7_9BASI|nr:25S rRNA (cytosine(2870)-C(5))-methyltransferase [Malassezia caprae]
MLPLKGISQIDLLEEYQILLLCVGTPKGFEIVDLETLDTQGLLDPADISLDFVQRCENLKPIAIFRVDGEFLLCYNEFAFYVNKNGWRARSGWIINWEGNPNAFAMHYPYVLAFEPNFIEPLPETGATTKKAKLNNAPSKSEKEGAAHFKVPAMKGKPVSQKGKSARMPMAGDKNRKIESKKIQSSSRSNKSAAHKPERSLVVDEDEVDDVADHEDAENFEADEDVLENGEQDDEDIEDDEKLPEDDPSAPSAHSLSEANILASLGLPKGGKLSARQKKKALAEAERLELLLKSQGYSLDDEEEVTGDLEQDEPVEEELGEEDGVELDDEFDGAEEDLQDEFVGHEDDEELDDEAGDDRDLPSDDDEELDEEVAEDGLPSDDDDENTSGFLLPTLEEEEQEQRAPLDLQFVQMRIQEVVSILGNLAHLGEPGRSRADYMDRLAKDVQTYYGYNEFLTTMFLELFSPEEAIAFFEANEVPRPVTIRANTLRTRRRDLAQKLINRGVSLEPVGAWSKVGLQVFESSVPIGATPEYLVGDYMLQAVSSFLPCIALAPQPNERVLDMASAPGGKVTYLSALMQNTGCIFANDSNKARIKSLTANIHRMGCRNVVVCNYDGRQFPKVIGGFDRVMLDSPCSGTGVVSKDPSVKSNKSKRDFILLSQLQKQLILCAIDSVNPRSETGGYVVYSTCSVTVEENEEVVEYALRKRPNVRIVPTGIDFGRDGFKTFRGKKFDERMPLCRRIFPHVHNMDGFFVCKLKVEPVNKGEKRRQEAEAAEIDEAAERTAATSSTLPPKAATKVDDNSSLFNDEEDSAIMERSRARMAKKRRM